MTALIYLETTRHDPVSAAIRFATRSPWSHAGFLVYGRYLSAQWRGGVRLRKPTPGVQRILLEAPGVNEAAAIAAGQTGKPYDLSAVLGIGLDRDWRYPDRWFCSELVAWAFEQAGFPLLSPAVPVSRITPRDLLLSSAVQLVRSNP